MTIEPGYPALGLAEAREQARAALQSLAKGGRPRGRQAGGEGRTRAHAGGCGQGAGAGHDRARALSDGEIRTVWQAAGGLAYPFGAFFRMAPATAQRRSEVPGMRWADIDETEKTWTLPAELTNADRAHVVPLSPLALAILADCPRCSSHVFTTGRRRGSGAGAGDEPISRFSKAKAMLDAKVAEIAATVEAERVAPWRLHDLRRAAATIMGRLRVSRFALGRLLNHTDGSVTGIYDRHEYLDEKRQALEAWSRFLENLISSPGANVTPLRRTASPEIAAEG